MVVAADLERLAHAVVRDRGAEAGDFARDAIFVRQRLVECLRDAAIDSVPVGRQAYCEIAVTERHHRSVQLARARIRLSAVRRRREF